MTELSPAAKAILNNVAEQMESEDSLLPYEQEIVAAALRAAVNQAKETPWPGRIESVGAMWMRDQLLSIANELEGT